jgi:hypothetical protein
LIYRRRVSFGLDLLAEASELSGDAPCRTATVTLECAPDALSPAHSSLREKVLEHAFLVDLCRTLWKQGRRDFEVLRAEVDRGGYDVVVECAGTVRHIQLKSSHREAKTSEVAIQTALALKPSGCVLWLLYDPLTLDLGPFLWFGGEPGERLRDLGTKVARHSKGNKDGYKAERQALRVVDRRNFRTLGTMEEVATKLFGDLNSIAREPGSGPYPWAESGAFKSEVLGALPSRPRAHVGALAPRATGAIAPTPRHEVTQLELLRAHLRAQAAPQGPGWLTRVREGDFQAIPSTLEWSNAALFAHLIDGYRLCEEAGLGDPSAYEALKFQEAQRLGKWVGSALELWVSLFLESRADRFQGGYPRGDERQLDALCRDLRASLVAEAGGREQGRAASHPRGAAS